MGERRDAELYVANWSGSYFVVSVIQSDPVYGDQVSIITKAESSQEAAILMSRLQYAIDNGL